jgi:hypothetical protein
MNADTNVIGLMDAVLIVALALTTVLVSMVVVFFVGFVKSTKKANRDEELLRMLNSGRLCDVSGCGKHAIVKQGDRCLCWDHRKY